MNPRVVSAVKSKITGEADFLNYVSQEIWKNPELKHEEKKAHNLLTKALTDKGFTVTPNFVLPTAFRAEFSGRNRGPAIAVICEYDALPEVGHTCGHNLIAEAGLGAALGLKAAFEEDPALPGKVVVFGTPAEEGGGGKLSLIDAGAFNDIDVALMVHPAPDDHVYPPFIAIKRIVATYIGKEAHAAGYPWDGLNALDAAVACYTNVALLRQHIKPTCKIHGVITNGGIVPNIIPALSELNFCYRAATTRDMADLKNRLLNCFSAAALATGCELRLSEDGSSDYESLVSNRVLAELYKKYAEQFGVQFQDGNPKVIPFMASSDMGNVSHVVPSIHPTYFIGTKAANHSVAFAEAAGEEKAQRPTLIAAQAMALLAVEVLSDEHLMKSVKGQFMEDLANDC